MQVVCTLVLRVLRRRRHIVPAQLAFFQPILDNVYPERALFSEHVLDKHYVMFKVFLFFG